MIADYEVGLWGPRWSWAKVQRMATMPTALLRRYRYGEVAYVGGCDGGAQSVRVPSNMRRSGWYPFCPRR